MRPMADIKIDLGCGDKRRDGYLGLDYVAGAQVDHVLDLTKEPYPFEDRSVDAVFSAHFLEHIEEPNHVFSEIGRICKDGAKIEFWTPYAFTNEAFVYGHRHFLTEDDWMHFCVLYRDVFLGMLGGRWLLRKIVYAIPRENVRELEHAGFTLDFAVKYLKGVVNEFGVEIEFQSDPSVPPATPERVYVTDRFGEQRPLTGRGRGRKGRFRR
jgi:SAM-dependent methyltransferase